MGAAGSGDCKDFADCFVVWISRGDSERRKSRFLARLGMRSVLRHYKG